MAKKYPSTKSRWVKIFLSKNIIKKSALSEIEADDFYDVESEDITIDGKSVGRTPLQLDNLLVGEHTVKITKQGYKEFVQKITISEGTTAKLSATLTKVATPATTATTTTSAACAMR